MIILHDIVNFSVATLQLAIYTSIRSIGTKQCSTVSSNTMDGPRLQ